MMFCLISPLRHVSLGLVFAVCFAIGCGGSPVQKFIPATTVARTALETALKEWKAGTPYGPVKGFTVPIDVYDGRWQSKKKLEIYEILREEKSDGPKIFVVKMKLDSDKEEQEVKYFIVGNNPLLVFREQDYNKASGSGG